jgi:ABC-type lipoprotein release transport system permease subunit
MALGAAHADVFKLVLHDGMVMFLAGTALGAFGAIATAQFLHDRLLAELRIWDRDFTDVGLLVLCEGVLIVTALVACLGPARRAMRTDPVEMLRSS